MRDHLDEINDGQRTKIQNAIVDANEQIRQFKETISVLREEMESVQFKASSDSQKTNSKHETELLQLRDTIFAMRNQMVQMKTMD